MHAKHIRKLLCIGSSLGVVLPPSLLDEIGAQRGDTFVVSLAENDSVILTPLTKWVGTLPESERAKGIIKL